MAKQGKQLHVTVEDRVGKLADVTDKLKEAGVNLLAACAWVEGRQGHMVFVPDDPDKACQAVKDAVGSCEASDAICFTVPDKAGALNEAAHKLAEAGIAIQLVYATAAGKDVLVVMQTSDNAKAAQVV